MFRTAVLAAGIACASAHAQGAPQALPGRVQDLLARHAIPESAVGASVLRARDGAVLYAFNEKAALQPASTIKTLTAIVALDTLGPAFRARTELRGPKPDEHGVVAGNVALVGQGSVDFTAEALARMLGELRLRGAQVIRGDVVIDREWFQPARGDLGVPPFDETPEFQYNVIPDALSLNGNLFRLDLVADGKTLRTRMVPALEGVSIDNAMTLIDGKCADWEDGWILPQVTRRGDATDSDAATTLSIRIHGTFPRNCSASTQLNLIDRADFAARLFRALWRELGGELQGTVRERVAGEAAVEAPVLAAHSGRSLAEIVRDINKRSDNPVTRVTYLHLGKSVAEANAKSTSELSERVVRDWLKARGIDDAGLVLENGSGLSRTERISAQTLSRVVWEAGKSKWAPEFTAALPIVAVDGGMRNRLKDSPAREWGRFKTGTLRNTTALTGIAPAKSGESLVITVILNHDNAKSAVARPIVDAMVEHVLANH
ncbi:MAG: D-alanyl-D-alanine carboxypeptidase/D-alanyl-D-alanine-endopeptidase [Betaproteobacteria bacterium]|nr:D-alanyl-D-alanine carboxypeptidase/D-alanyl-D-alanine-endopeptidase [Betaproteobacteria bacterium]